MPFEWVADHDPFPSKKKGGSSRRQTLRPTSGKKSAKLKVPELASNEVMNSSYLEYLRMKGCLGGNNHSVGSSEPNVGGLSHNNNEREQPVGGESTDKSAEVNVGDENVNNGVAINDPQYKLFLENLRVDGSGGFYVEVEPHSGLRESLRYEPERRTKPIKAQRRSEPPSERENDAVLEVQDLECDGNGISVNISRQRKRRENGNAKCMKNISGEGKRFKGCYTVTEDTSEELCEEVEANGQTKLRHENVTYQRTTTRKTEAPERENDGVIEILNSSDDGESKSDKISRRRKRREKKKEKFLKNKSRKRKRVISASKTTEGSNEKDSRVVSWDDSYLAFMLCLRGDADLCIYTSSNGKQVKYPEEEGEGAESSSSSDVEILSAEDVSRFETNMGFVISRYSYEAGVDLTPPILREKVIAELNRPYDRTEYDNLLKEIKVRKPQSKCRQLRRSRDVAYETNVTCRSYLEMHPVLGRKLQLVDGNAPATLNLLRGFFFWLKHVPYDMFQPWTDRECLNILPPTTADDAPSLPPPDASTAIQPFKGKKRIKKAKIEW